MSSIYVVWDESHIWGLLVWRALEAMQLPYRVVRGQEISQGVLSGKRPALLLVPGGNARLKSEALGEAGRQAIRDYVASGGSYLGFCGGAGLGLTSPDGLNLCPWGRARFTDRMQHFVSGHIRARITTPSAHPPVTVAPLTELADVTETTNCANTPRLAENTADVTDLIPTDIGPEPLVPVWWPARFAPEEGTDVQVLASYTEPGNDFWVADLPLDTLPPGTFSEWEDLYGIRLRPTFLTGQPCVISGQYGKGRYVLSYTHLETPDSPQANRWLAHIIHTLSQTPQTPKGIRAGTSLVPPWELDSTSVVWNDAALVEARDLFADIITTGKNHSLFFQRNAWLVGWRAGIPGANLNNLHTAIGAALSTAPTPDAEHYWCQHRERFLTQLRLFQEGVTGYLLAERLAMTLSKTFPEAVTRELLKNQRTALFGPPMDSGGLYVELLEILDELLFRLMPHE